MRLEEGDIALRPFTEADVPAITAARQDPEIPRWTSVPSPYSEDDARSFVAEPGDHRAFAVVDASTDALLGSVGFWLEGTTAPASATGRPRRRAAAASPRGG